jgi:signal transduction histidine kinase
MSLIPLASIRAKLIALFLVGGVLPIALVSLIAYFNSLKAVEDMVGNRTDRLAQSVGEDLSRKLQRRVNDRILIENRPVQDYLEVRDGIRKEDQVSSYQNLRVYLDNLFEEYQNYYSDLVIAGDDGDPIFSYHGGEGAEAVPLAAAAGAAAGAGPPDTLVVPALPETDLGQQLTQTLEALGRNMTGKLRDELRREHAADSLRALQKGMEISDRVSKLIEKALEAADANVNLQSPSAGSAPFPSTPHSVILRGLPPNWGFTDSDLRAVKRGSTLARGEVLVYADRVSPGGARVLRLVMPIFSVDQVDRRLGTLVANLRMDYLFPEDLAAERFGANGELAVVNSSDGEILFHSRHELVGRNIRLADHGLVDAFAGDAGSEPPSAPWIKVPGERGTRLASAIGLGTVPWTVFATALPREFESEARRAGIINLLVACLALLLAGSLLVVAGGRISRSVGVVTAGAREIAAGNLYHSIRVKTHDEIQTLGETFNAMTASLRENIELREKAARELEALNRTLEDRVQERTRELEALNKALNEANRELKELDRLKSNFLSTVSHEFRTPLTSIKAFSEILLDEAESVPATPEMKRFLGIINSESDRLGRLIKNLLSLSRLESGRLAWRMTEFEVREVAEAAVDGLLPAFKAKDIRLERHVECPGGRVRADRDRIQEVITNLLENAIKFSEPGGRVWIGCEEEGQRANGKPLLRVTVRDEGSGIPPGHLDRIFERFSQADASETRARGGSGLGLAICREIVEHHGGRIWAESTPGDGASFHFTLPLVGTSPDAEACETTKKGHGTPTGEEEQHV